MEKKDEQIYFSTWLAYAVDQLSFMLSISILELYIHKFDFELILVSFSYLFCADLINQDYLVNVYLAYLLFKSFQFIRYHSF